MAYPPSIAFQETTLPCILNAPTFCIHVNEVTTNKDIKLISILNYLLMNTPAFFNCNYTHTCTQHCQKGSRDWLYAFMLHLSKEIQCLVPLPTLHISENDDDIPRDNIACRHFVEYSPSILPHLAYMSTRLLPTQTFDSQPLWLTCLCTCLPSSCACKFARALSTWTKVRLSGGMPSCCICWKSCLIFSYCPVLAYLASLAFQWKMLNCKVHGAIAANSTSTHGGFNLSLSHRASFVCLCLKSG